MKKYLFFIFTFILLVILPSVYFSNKLSFTNVGDNITYIMQAESIYYDHDFKLEKKDFKRMYAEYPQIVKKLPIISKQDADGNLTFGKPIFITIYFALFTPIQNPIHRGLVANLFLAFFLYISAYVLIKDKKLFVLFCVLMLFSQFNFYLPEVHPEVFTNAFVLMSSLPMFAVFSKKTWIYSVAGVAGGILIFEKQLAIFFPLVTLVYLYFKEKKYFKRYFIFFIMTCFVGLGINYYFHGDAIAYQGQRGLSSFDGKTIKFMAQGVIKPFTFPLTYFDRFKDYFFGKIIGIVVYNASFVLFLIGFSLKFRIPSEVLENASSRVKKLYKYFSTFLIYTPALLYVASYFFVVDTSFSYGGATTIGNRYFFQIYFYVVLVTILAFQSKIKSFKAISKNIFISSTFGIVLLFSVFIYRPFYRNYSRAIMDHFVIVLNNDRTFGMLPLELSYYPVVLSDLVEENKIEDRIFVLNNARPVIQEENGKWLPEGISEIVEVTGDDKFYLEEMIINKKESKYSVVKVRTLKLDSAFYKGFSVALFKINCKTFKQDKDKCIIIK